jgi:iron complex outermembrane receptor protein
VCNRKSKISVNLGNKKKLAFAVTMALGLSSAYANEDVNKEISSNDDIEHMTILGKITSGEYRNDFASSATKTFTNNLDIAQPVDVVNQALIDSQLALQLDDVYRNSASVNIVDPLGHTNIRGFRLNENSGGILKNGLREVSQGFAFPSLANIEKIEILKGSSSALYGRGEPGGIINLITKKPQKEDFTRLSFALGSDDFYQLNIDYNKKVSEDLQFRVNVEINDTQSYRDEVDSERVFIAPAVTYQINESQKITAEMEFNSSTRTRDQGIAAIDGDISILSNNTYLGAGTDVETDIYTFQLTHEWFINNDWALISKFRLGHDDTDDELFNPFTEGVQTALNSPAMWLNNTNSRTYRTFTSADDIKDELNLDINITGEIDAFGAEHGLLFGFNVNQRRVDRDERIHYNELLRQTLRAVNPALVNYSLASYVDPFNPKDATKIALPTALSAIPGLNNQFEYTNDVVLNQFKTDIVSTGFYVQDQVRFNDRWQVVLGARFDHHTYDVVGKSLNTVTFAASDFAFNNLDDSQSENTFAPKAAILYSPIEDVSLYASYAKQFDVSIVANEARVIKSNGQEYGIKWNIGEDLTTSIAYFDILKTDVLDVSSFNVTNVIDEVSSKGFEASILGRMTPHWVISANYSDFTAEIEKDDDKQETIGNSARGTSDKSGAVWVRYNLEAMGKKGLSLAIGVNYVGERPVDNANSFDLPDFTLVDVMATYQFDNDVKVRLKVDNVTDERWYSGSYTSQSVFVGNGTKATLSVDFEI